MRQQSTNDLTEASEGLTSDILRQYNSVRKQSAPITCYAPFKSLYFGHNGYVVVCCYNRNYQLGQYPQASIREIWFGQRAEKLREYIKKNDFSHGCQQCLAPLLAQNYQGVKALQYDNTALNASRYPSSMEFELDNTCNLECVMCNGTFSSLIRENREGRPALNVPYGNDFLVQLEEFVPHLEEVKFYGGEPFLIEIYYRIIDLIITIKPSIRISIQTNGTVLNNRVKSILEKTKVHLNVSIDSLQRETYEAIRQNARFNRVMENVRYFHAYCNEHHTFFGISMCVMRNNWRELPAFVKYCNGLNAPVYFHSVSFPLDTAIHNLPQPELTEIVNVLKQALHLLPEHTPVQQQNKSHYVATINTIDNWRMAAITAPAMVIVHSMEEIIARIDSAIDDFGNIDVKYNNNRRAITNKLLEVKKLLPDDFDYTHMFPKGTLEAKDLDFLITCTVDEMLNAFHAF